MLLTLLMNLNMFSGGSSDTSSTPSYISEKQGGRYNKGESEEKTIGDIINDDDETIVLILQGFFRVKGDMRKRIKYNQWP